MKLWSHWKRSVASAVRPVLFAVCGLALVALALVPATSLADGDPASDVLLGENVFYPYAPPVSQSAQKALDAETAAAKELQFPLKVALIASPVDLGAVSDLFGKPQKYADFLDQEISGQGKQPLLVVMAAGYGAQGVSSAARRALASLPKPGRTSNDLASAAVTGVARLASASGYPLKTSPTSSSGSGGSSSATTILLILLIVAAFATAGAALFVRRRDAATDVANDAQRLLEVALALHERGDLEAAASAYLLAEERGEPEGGFNLGVVLYEVGDIAGAEVAWRRCLHYQHARAAINLGVVLQQRGDLEGARSAYHAAESWGDPEGQRLGAALHGPGEAV